MMPVSEERQANVTRRDERRRYVRRNLLRYVPAFILVLSVFQWLVRPEPFSAASIKEALFLMIVTTAIGVPWAAYRLGKRWDQLHGSDRAGD